MFINRSEKANLISVIMAAYNAEKTIESAIRSVLEQSYSEWELIVVNDCSTDKTSEIVTRLMDGDKRIHLINNEKNAGVSITRKNGLECSSGEWIAILDSDDLWAPDKLEKQMKLASEKNAELVYTGSAFISSDGSSINWVLHVPETISYRKLLKQNLVSNSSVLVKKRLYQDYYAVGDNMHEDFAIWLGITKSGCLAYGIDEPLLTYRLAKSSKSGNKLKAAKMNWKTYRYVGLNPVSSTYYMCWYTVKGVLKYRHLK